MNTRKILYPTDFSTTGQTAMEMATSLARDSGATLVIMHVEEPPMAYGGGEFYYGMEEPNREELRRMLAEVGPTDPNVPCERRLMIGTPATAIVELAQSDNVDMIVMATHGRTGLSRVLMGSVAEEVVRKAHCPVLTVKPAPHVATKKAAAACTTAPA